MWKRSLAFIFGLSLFFYLSSAFAGICCASQQYTISETELETLQNHLSELERNNEVLKAILSESGEELTAALNALTESQKELTMLRNELTQCRNDVKSANESLEKANLELQNARISFRESEKEHDKIEGRLRTQRNIWEILCFLAVGAAIAK